MSIARFIAKQIWNQAWLSPRYKKTAYKILNKAGEAPSAAFTSNFYGLRYEGNLQNNIEFSIYYYGAFEKPLLYFLRDTLANIKRHPSKEPASCYCDIGANIGQHALFMSQYASTVHAFEPFSAVSERMLSQIKLNHIDNIHLHSFGLSDKTESLPFYAPTGSNQGIGSFDRETESKGNVESGSLALKNGDEFFAELPIEYVDLMKIDVEGFERKALAGLTDVLGTNRPIVVCEVSYGTELSFQSFEQWQAAFPQGYKFFIFDIRKPNGRKDRKAGAKAKRSGHYKLIPFSQWMPSGQDDVVACPVEKLDRLAMEYSR
jgi:FkbM family methyltransferase